MEKFILCIGLLIGLPQVAFSQFTGGFNDGYASEIISNPTSIFTGGNNSGHSSSAFINTTSIFIGGNSDGHNSANFSNSISIFSGGNKDGHASDEKLFYFIWTGNVGTGWNVSGNWNTGVIPNINNRVVIPSGPVNFPFVNAGIMSIGQDPSMGQYFCKQLNIHAGAEMTLRINSFLDNYGLIEVEGDLYVKNKDVDAFRILNGGKMDIESSGRLIFD